MIARVLEFGAARFSDAEKGALRAAAVRLSQSKGRHVGVTVEAGEDCRDEYAVLAVDDAQGEADAWAAYEVLGVVQGTRRPGRRWALLRPDGAVRAEGNDLAALLAAL